MPVIYSVPHAQSDEGALAVAYALAESVPGTVLVPRIPRHLGDSNRKSQEWPELTRALKSSARLIDVHSYGEVLSDAWYDKIRWPHTPTRTPILVVMVLPGQAQDELYTTYFSKFPRIAGTEENRNVNLVKDRGILLEFNSEAAKRDLGPVVAAVKAFTLK